MLLAIDIGNSQVVVGVFEGRTLRAHWRLATDQSKTTEEYGVLLLSLLRMADLSPAAITGAILSSVVPPLTPTFQALTETYFRRPPLLVSPELDTGLTLAYPNPRELGSDRIGVGVMAWRTPDQMLHLLERDWLGRWKPLGVPVKAAARVCHSKIISIR